MILIIGAGGHARDIAWWLARTRPDEKIVMCEEADVTLSHVINASTGIVGVNDPRVRSEITTRFGARFPDAGWWLATAGPTVSPDALVGPDVQLGNHVHVNGGAFLTRCTIGDFTTVGPNATICGDVTIGARCLIGAGAVIKNLVTIGDDVTVGAGAVVVNDIPDGKTVMGVPAR